MAGKRGVVGLDIELEVLVQVVRLEEADARLRVVVVLVLHRLARLGLDQQLEGGLAVEVVVEEEVVVVGGGGGGYRRFYDTNTTRLQVYHQQRVQAS